jgi:hypothetical protein
MQKQINVLVLQALQDLKQTVSDRPNRSTDRAATKPNSAMAISQEVWA